MGGSVDKLGREDLPLLLKHVSEGVDDLDAVIDGGIVARSNHDADGLAVELAASEGSEEANAESDSIE